MLFLLYMYSIPPYTAGVDAELPGLAIAYVLEQGVDGLEIRNTKLRKSLAPSFIHHINNLGLGPLAL